MFTNAELFYMSDFVTNVDIWFEQAYVQQLESSRIKLSQLEQELQRARSQVEN